MQIEQALQPLFHAKAQKLAKAEATPVLIHLTEWDNVLAAKGVTLKHREQQQGYAKRVLREASCARVSDLTVSKVQIALAALAKRDGVGPVTLNHLLAAVKAFSKWLHDDGRSMDDPLRLAGRFKTGAGFRHPRRPLTEGELQGLIRAADAHPRKVCGVTGRDRAMLYRLAIGTGFRAGELRSLTPESFDLDATPPCILLKAAHSKNRHAYRQPIRFDLAVSLVDWLEQKPKGKPIIDIYSSAKFVRMLRADLKAAGIPYHTADGYADFHALRHTYCTRLVVQNTVDLKTVQELARHHSAAFTIQRYAHSSSDRKVAALESLGEMPQAPRTNRSPGGVKGGNYPQGESNPCPLAENQSANPLNPAALQAQSVPPAAGIVRAVASMSTAQLEDLINQLELVLHAKTHGTEEISGDESPESPAEMAAKGTSARDECAAASRTGVILRAD